MEVLFAIEDHVMPLTPGFTTLQHVYDLPGQVAVDASNFRLEPFWFSEINVSDERTVLLAIHTAGRLVARTVGQWSSHNDEDESLMTLWFDEEPFAVVQQQGYDGHRHRWVTDRGVFLAACQHVLTMTFDHENREDQRKRGFVRADVEHPMDTVFGFGHHNLGKHHGLVLTTVAENDFMYVGERVLDGLEKDQVLILSMSAHPVPLLRRRGHYFRFDHALSAHEHARNPRIALHNQQDGRQGAWVYNALEEQPEDYRQAVVF